MKGPSRTAGLSAVRSNLESPNIVVGSFNFVRLLLDDLSNIQRNIFGERVAIRFHGNVFAALRFRNNRRVIMTGHHGFQVNPAPVGGAGEGSRLARFPA